MLATRIQEVTEAVQEATIVIRYKLAVSASTSELETQFIEALESRIEQMLDESQFEFLAVSMGIDRTTVSEETEHG